MQAERMADTVKGACLGGRRLVWRRCELGDAGASQPEVSRFLDAFHLTSRNDCRTV